MPNLRYFAECEVQNGASYCFLIVSSFHVLIIEAPCTGLETVCVCVHESVTQHAYPHTGLLVEMPYRYMAGKSPCSKMCLSYCLVRTD